MNALLALVLAAMPSVQLDGFTHVKQKPDFGGEAAIEMALRRAGRDVHQDDVFNLSGLDPAKGRGMRADDLRKVLRTLGFEPGQTWYRVRPARAKTELAAHFGELHEDLTRGVPSIVRMHDDAQPKTTGHFLLITGYDAQTDEVVYEEPAEDDGHGRRMKRADFLSLWPVKKAEAWTVIRLRLDEQSKPVLPAFEAPTPAEVVQHVMALKETMPAGFTVVWEKPFLVIGNESPEKVRGRAKDVVGWTRDLLLKDFFPRAPTTMEDVWIFKDAATYEKYSRELFETDPHTPYGFYLSHRRSMLMNIKPGYGTLTHELVHPFMHANWPDGPAWLNEGLGSLFEFAGERDGHLIGQLNWRLPCVQEAIRSNTVPEISTLVKTTSAQFYDDDSGVHYAMARYLCYWLQERGLLIAFVRRALELKAEDPTALKALTEVLGADPDAVQKDWEKFTLALKRRRS